MAAYDRLVMRRVVVLFAREPGREARSKSLAAPGARGLFALFAEGWRRAAGECGARLILATPAEDRLAWRRCLRGAPDLPWMRQRGAFFGERLENAAREAASLGGRAVLVGGDVRPSSVVLAEAFAALEAGADAVLTPAPDGGFSLVGLPAEDVSLLARVGPRRRRAFAELFEALCRRGRRVAVTEAAPDVDSPSGLRRLRESLAPGDPLRGAISAGLQSKPRELPAGLASPWSAPKAAPSSPRAPPRAA